MLNKVTSNVWNFGRSDRSPSEFLYSSFTHNNCLLTCTHSNFSQLFQIISESIYFQKNNIWFLSYLPKSDRLAYHEKLNWVKNPCLNFTLRFGMDQPGSVIGILSVCATEMEMACLLHAAQVHLLQKSVQQLSPDI